MAPNSCLERDVTVVLLALYTVRWVDQGLHCSGSYFSRIASTGPLYVIYRFSALGEGIWKLPEGSNFFHCLLRCLVIATVIIRQSFENFRRRKYGRGRQFRREEWIFQNVPLERSEKAGSRPLDGPVCLSQRRGAAWLRPRPIVRPSVARYNVVGAVQTAAQWEIGGRSQAEENERKRSLQEERLLGRDPPLFGSRHESTYQQWRYKASSQCS